MIKNLTLILLELRGNVQRKFNIMKFKVGQTVIFKGADFMSAKAGATAVVTGLGRYLEVNWVRNVLCKTQMNGGYDYKDFEPALQEGEQMEFAFMKEAQ